jgi:hypothetical protein
MILDPNGWKYYASMPFPLWRHCIVQYNDVEVMILAGFRNKDLNVQTLIYNFHQNYWTQHDAKFLQPRQEFRP